MAPVSRLPVPVESHWSWQHDAACRGMDVDAFFHPSSERGAERRRRDERAKQVCARCPVVGPCRDWAHRVQEPFGVWGGESEDERWIAIRRTRRDAR